MATRALTRLLLVAGVALGTAMPAVLRSQIGSAAVLDDSRLPAANRREVRLFHAALQRLEDDRPDEAIVYLQTILDTDVDGFFERDESGRLVSLRGETIRCLETLPDDAKRAYALRYEATATARLEAALKNHDATTLALVARRFPTTTAGRDAARRLALIHFDRGELLAAVARLERLRQRTAGKPHVESLVLLARCHHRLGAAASCRAVLNELEEQGGNVVLAGRQIDVTDAETLRNAIAKAETPKTQDVIVDWPVAGGGPARRNFRSEATGKTTGQAIEWSVSGLPDPFLTTSETKSPLQTQLLRWSAQTALLELAGGWPACPSARPVAAGGTIYARTPSRLVAFDAANGERRWRSLADPLCWEYLSDTVWESPEGEVAARTFVGQRLWSDATWGVPSTDGQIVFAVEETGAAQSLPTVSEATPPATGGPQLPEAFNRLVAYEAATGRRLWEAGGPPGHEAPLAGAFFYGAPVPAGGQWFALAEIAGVTHVVALNPHQHNGLLWTQPIAEHGVTIDHNPIRRTAGLSPCVAGGLLVCPVSAGLVVAVDPATRLLLWAWTPAEGDLPERSERRNFGEPRRRSHAIPEVIAAGTRVLIASPATGVAAVSAVDGTLQWQSTEFAGLWLVGVNDEAVYLQTPTGIAALRLSDGAPTWSSPAVIGPPSGCGIIVGGRLHIPLADATLAELDAATGRVVSRRPVPGHESLGNLAIVGGSLISQSATHLIAMPIEESPMK